MDLLPKIVDDGRIFAYAVVYIEGSTCTMSAPQLLHFMAAPKNSEVSSG
jgi:hypothetical protein